MRVLITRPEREATALAQALGRARPLAGHRAAVPAAGAASARRLRRGAGGLPGRAAHQRQRRARARRSERAAQQADLRRRRHDRRDRRGAGLRRRRSRRRAMPRPWPTWCASGSIPRPVRCSMCPAPMSRRSRALAPDGFEVQPRRALRGARGRGAARLGARRAGGARARCRHLLLAARVGRSFVRLVDEAEPRRNAAATSPRSPSARPPPSRSAALPFKATVAAARPTRQAVLDEIDRLPPPGVQGPRPHERHPSSPPRAAAAGPRRRRPLRVRRGLGVVGAFVTGLVAAVIVLAGALVSLPYWPQEARTLWRGPAVAPAPRRRRPAAGARRRRRRSPTPPPLDAAKRELAARLDDLDKRVRAAAADGRTAPTGRPTRPIAELREPGSAALEIRADRRAAPRRRQRSAQHQRRHHAESDKDVAALQIRDRDPARGPAVARPDGRRPEGTRSTKRDAAAATRQQPPASRRRWPPRAPRR